MSELSLGWKLRHWKTKVFCVSCPRAIRAGRVHHKDEADPPTRAMCLRCSSELDEDPKAFALARDPSMEFTEPDLDAWDVETKRVDPC